MTALVPMSHDAKDLPGLIDRAASTLAGAKTAAEVLEAGDKVVRAQDGARNRVDGANAIASTAGLGLCRAEEEVLA